MVNQPSRKADKAAPPAMTQMPRNVKLLGLTSFFSDISSEMIYPLIPIFLTTTLGAPVEVVGLIEGVAESTASIMKLVAGWFSDKAGRRLPFVVTGYGLAAIGKLFLAAAHAWPVVLVGRFIDRFGKGVRTSPRDALIADSTPQEMRGRAFGLHRAMDTGGAVVGPLLGLALVAALDERLRLVFLIAVIPGVLSVGCLLLVKERRAHTRPQGEDVRFTLRGLDSRLLFFLLASTVFALGNSSDVFLLLRAKELGLSTTGVVLTYVVYNVVFMSAAFPAGVISDRVGPKRVMVSGLLVFAAVYTGFALADRALYIWPLFAVYGLYVAMTDGIAKALVTDLTPESRRASLLGTHGMLIGLAALVASLVAGVLWDAIGPWAPFALGAIAALLGATLLFRLVTIPEHEPAR